MKHVPQALQCTVDGRLTEQKSCCGARGISFFGKRGEYDQEVEVGLT